MSWRNGIREALQRLSDDLSRALGERIDLVSIYRELEERSPRLLEVVDDWLNGIHAATHPYGNVMVEYAATVVAYRAYITSLGRMGDAVARRLSERIDELMTELISEKVDMDGNVLIDLNKKVTGQTTSSQFARR